MASSYNDHYDGWLLSNWPSYADCDTKLVDYSGGSSFTLSKHFSSAHKTNLNLEEIRQQLGEFKGGEVSLSSAGKDGAIRVITISHPERRNAFSGSLETKCNQMT